jgi:hypothetical protein
MTQARTCLQQEVLRLGGDYAHVLDEYVDSRHDCDPRDLVAWPLRLHALPPSRKPMTNTGGTTVRRAILSTSNPS